MLVSTASTTKPHLAFSGAVQDNSPYFSNLCTCDHLAMRSDGVNFLGPTLGSKIGFETLHVLGSEVVVGREDYLEL